MPPEADSAPDDPRAWLLHAREDLAPARAEVPGVSFGPRCYHAQQAAEKAIKAVLLAYPVRFPFVHDIGVLLDLARKAAIEIPPDVAVSDLLTDYATIGRYPGLGEVEQSDYDRAIASASVVVEWASTILKASTGDS